MSLPESKCAFEYLPVCFLDQYHCFTNELLEIDGDVSVDLPDVCTMMMNSLSPQIPGVPLSDQYHCFTHELIEISEGVSVNMPYIDTVSMDRLSPHVPCLQFLISLLNTVHRSVNG